MFKRFPIVTACIVLLSASLAAQAQRHVPTLDDLLTIQSVAGTQISPDGKWIAYTIGYGDFKQDAFITQICLVNGETGKSFQLTRGEKSSTSPRWSPDGQWLAFLSNRIEDKNQIFLISPEGGEAQQLTKSETAINKIGRASCRERVEKQVGAVSLQKTEE